MSHKKASLAVFALHRFIALQTGAPVSIGRLNEHCGVSVSYLEQVFSGLLKAGLVVSTRGPGGGYTAAADISVGDVVRVFVTKGYLLTEPVLAALNEIRIADLPEGFSL